MVTHVPPPSPSLSSASLSTITGSIPPYNRGASSRAHSQARSSASQRYTPAAIHPPPPPSVFQIPSYLPPSPPLSHSHASSPPSSYVAPRLPEPYAQSAYTSSRHTPSLAGSRVTTSAARESSRRKHRSSTQSQAESRHAPKRQHSRAGSVSSQSDNVFENDHNEFPWFGQTGDVELTLKTRDGAIYKRYLLHGLILKQNSKWWARSLESTSANPSTASDTRGRSQELQEEGRSTRSRSSFTVRSSRRRSERKQEAEEPVSQTPSSRSYFELDWSSAPAHEGIPLLQPALQPSAQSQPARERSRPPASSASFFRHFTSSHSRHASSSSSSAASSTSTNPTPPSQEDHDILTAYHHLLLSIYNYAPPLHADSPADAYVQSKILLKLATIYAALPVVRPRIEHHLLHFHHALYSQIARYPPSYLKLGHALHSRKIFTEALIHVVGQWPAHERFLQDVEPIVKELVEDKVDELREARERADGKLFRISLVTGRGERVGPRTGWTGWMAVSLFRQWVVDNTSPRERQGILKDKASKKGIEPTVSGKAYRLMAKGGEAYLTKIELKEFLKHEAPRECYSREGLKKLERRVEDCKSLARDAVRGLNRNFLDGGEEKEYLTCTRVTEGDLEGLWFDD